MLHTDSSVVVMSKPSGNDVKVVVVLISNEVS
jgi:hypothetical protein